MIQRLLNLHFLLSSIRNQMKFKNKFIWIRTTFRLSCLDMQCNSIRNKSKCDRHQQHQRLVNIDRDRHIYLEKEKINSFMIFFSESIKLQREEGKFADLWACKKLERYVVLADLNEMIFFPQILC